MLLDVVDVLLIVEPTRRRGSMSRFQCCKRRFPRCCLRPAGVCCTMMSVVIGCSAS